MGGGGFKGKTNLICRSQEPWMMRAQDSCFFFEQALNAFLVDMNSNWNVDS